MCYYASGTNYATNNGVLTLVKQCKLLRIISLEGFPLVTTDILPDLLSALPKLEEIHLREGMIQEEGKEERGSLRLAARSRQWITSMLEHDTVRQITVGPLTYVYRNNNGKAMRELVIGKPSSEALQHYEAVTSLAATDLDEYLQCLSANGSAPVSLTVHTQLTMEHWEAIVHHCDTSLISLEYRSYHKHFLARTYCRMENAVFELLLLRCKRLRQMRLQGLVRPTEQQILSFLTGEVLPSSELKLQLFRWGRGYTTLKTKDGRLLSFLVDRHDCEEATSTTPIPTASHAVPAVGYLSDGDYAAIVRDQCLRVLPIFMAATVLEEVVILHSRKHHSYARTPCTVELMQIIHCLFDRHAPTLTALRLRNIGDMGGYMMPVSRCMHLSSLSLENLYSKEVFGADGLERLFQDTAQQQRWRHLELRNMADTPELLKMFCKHVNHVAHVTLDSTYASESSLDAFLSVYGSVGWKITMIDWERGKHQRLLKPLQKHKYANSGMRVEFVDATCIVQYGPLPEERFRFDYD